MPAMCLDLSCDYSYTQSTSDLNTQSLSTTDLLTLGGSLLSNSSTDQISIGGVGCTVSSTTDTEILCQLNGPRVSGNWKAQILTTKGLIPNSIADANKILIPVEVSTISPSTNVNYLGGDIMTIIGTKFGDNSANVQVTYADGT